MKSLSVMALIGLCYGVASSLPSERRSPPEGADIVKPSSRRVP